MERICSLSIGHRGGALDDSQHLIAVDVRAICPVEAEGGLVRLIQVHGVGVFARWTLLVPMVLGPV